MLYINFIFLFFFFYGNLLASGRKFLTRKNIETIRVEIVKNRDHKEKVAKQNFSMNKKNSRLKLVKKTIKQKSSDNNVTRIENNNSNNNSNLSNIIGALFSSQVHYAHIFNYIGDFYQILYFQKSFDKKIIDELRGDLKIFQDFLMTLIDKNNTINIDQIKEYILKNDPMEYELYCKSNTISFLDKNSYVIEINPNSYLNIKNFLDENNINKLIKENPDINNNMSEKNKTILFFSDIINKLNASKILLFNSELKLNGTIIKIKKKIIQSNINDYFYAIKEKFTDEQFFQNIINNYLLYLLLEAEIVSRQSFEKIALKTMLNKKEVLANFKEINKALKKSGEAIYRLWEIITQNKSLFIKDEKKYTDIEMIDALGGMSQYLKTYIMQRKKKKLTGLEKVKNYLPAVAKVVGTAALIAGGIYAANAITGGAVIAKGVGLIGTFKDTVLNWFKEKSSSEIALKTITTNFVGVGLDMALSKPVDALFNNFTPAKAGVGGFVFGMARLAAISAIYSKITVKILEPIAKKLGFDIYNKSLYDLSKDQVKDFFNIGISNRYFQYLLSYNSINESFLIEKAIQEQKVMQYIIKSVMEDNYQEIAYVEGLFKRQLGSVVAEYDSVRAQNSILEMGKEIGRQEVVQKNQSLIQKLMK